MAIVTKTIISLRILLLMLACATALLLFINASEPEQNPHKVYLQFKENNNLYGYINYLFDKTDENPSLANKADSLLNTLWKSPSSVDEKLTFFQLLTNISYHLLQSGQIKASTRWYEQAFQFYLKNKTEQTLAKEMNVEEYVCKPLGNNYTRMGDFSKAMVMQQFAVSSAIEHGKAEMLPSLYANLATTTFYMQDYAGVQSITGKALDVINGEPGNAAILLYNLKTEAYFETGQMDSAKYWNRKALAQKTLYTDNTNWKVTALINRSRILNEAKRYNEAITYLQQAWGLSWSLNVKEKSKLSNEIGVAFAQLDQPSESKKWFKQALSFFKLDSLNLYPDFSVTAAMFGLARCYEAELNADSISYWSTQAVLNDYYTQQLIDAWMYSQSSLYSNQKFTEEAINWHHDYYEKTKNQEFLLKALWMAELSKGRILMFEQRRTKVWQQNAAVSETAFDELRNDYLLLAQATTQQEKVLIKERIANREFDLSLKENSFAQSLFAPSYAKFLSWLNNERKASCVVGYYATSKGTYMVQADRAGLTHFVDTTDIGLEKVSNFVSTYFYKGPQAFNNDPAGYYAASRSLLQKYLPNASASSTNYIIAPSGVLHQLPFEALSLKANEASFFGATNTISYQFSLLQLLNVAEAVKAPIDIFSFEEEHLGFPALPHANEEASYLKKVFKAKKYNAGETAESVFFASMNSGKVIHLSSHAVAGDSTTQPFIVLKNKVYLGQLQYNTAQCPLIVLAACETGKGAAMQNEGMLSLGRTFISKGVDGVLATRWTVDDAAASEIIKKFYSHLRQEKTPAAALQKARQLYLRENKNIAQQNPWLWAAFYYHGKNQEIEIQRTTSKTTIVFFIVAFLALSFITYKLFAKIK